MNSLVIEPTTARTALHLPDSVRLSHRSYREICRKNPDLHIEQEANGDITISEPSGSEGGRKNARLTTALGNWSDRFGGVVLDSSAGFRLPNGATRAPDAAWVSDARWLAVPAREREGFARLVPEFVVEIVSPRDSLPRQVAKMEEYAANGVSLGWLVIPRSREVRIFRPGAMGPDCLVDATSVAADESVLPRFVLDLTRIW